MVAQTGTKPFSLTAISDELIFMISIDLFLCHTLEIRVNLYPRELLKTPERECIFQLIGFLPSAVVCRVTSVTCHKLSERCNE